MPIRPKEEITTPTTNTNNIHSINHHRTFSQAVPSSKQSLANHSDIARSSAVMVTSSHQQHQHHTSNIIVMTSSPAVTYDKTNSIIASSSSVGMVMDGVGNKKRPTEGGSKFPCNKCGKVFTRKSHLTRHKLTHDQVKIYCDCGRLFRQTSHLQAHLPACKRKRQAIEAKYKAENASRSSSSLPNYNRHDMTSSSMTDVTQRRASSSPPRGYQHQHGFSVVKNEDSSYIVSSGAGDVANNSNRNFHDSNIDGEEGARNYGEGHYENTAPDEGNELSSFALHNNLPVGLPPLIHDPV